MATNKRIAEQQKKRNDLRQVWRHKFNSQLDRYREFKNRVGDSYRAPGA